MRYYTLVVLALLSVSAFGETVCLDGTSGFNGHVNVTEICLNENSTASIKIYYFNNLLPYGPTTCSGEAKYSKLAKGFKVTSLEGKCENGNIMAPQVIECLPVVNGLYQCNVLEYNAKFYVSKSRTI
ncbi:hypothetical protein NBRC116495_38250 [Aurantivibrio plasticivorans]